MTTININPEYYQKQIDKILYDAIGTRTFNCDDVEALVNHVSNTIFLFDQRLSLDNLQALVRLILLRRSQQFYIYDKVFNVPTSFEKETSDESESEETESSLMSLGENLDDYDTKVVLAQASDLVSHRYDYPSPKFTETDLIRRWKRVREIKKIPQTVQKSVEWLEQRRGCLTATAISAVIDEDPYKYPIDILLDKCGHGQPFIENKFVHHGNKYEDIASMYYCFRNNIQVNEYGLIQHPVTKFIGASPDGICDKYTMDSQTLSRLVGRLLEIKCPFTRRINTEGKLDGDICPHYYYVQVQTQLYVMQLDECDFLQCQIGEYASWDEYLKDCHPSLPGLSKKTNLEHGCVIQLIPKSMIGGDINMCLYNSKYLYPPRLHMNPPEIQEWIANELHHYHDNDMAKDYLIDRVIYWKLEKVACNLIKADREWFESKIPLLSQFWDYVKFYRDHPKHLESLLTWLKNVEHEESSTIFKKVHRDYKTVYPDTLYKPLYSEPTKWRVAYQRKAATQKKYFKSKI